MLNSNALVTLIVKIHIECGVHGTLVLPAVENHLQANEKVMLGNDITFAISYDICQYIIARIPYTVTNL